MTNSAKSDPRLDRMLIGIGASPGIAIGQAYLLARNSPATVEYALATDDVEKELTRFRDAVARAKEQLLEVRSKAAGHTLSEHLYIIDTHLLILEDQMLIGDTEAAIRAVRIVAESALHQSLKRFRAIFESIEDEYLRERGNDIDAVVNRLLRNLAGENPPALHEIDRQSIVVTHDLSPADTMQIDKERIIGFITHAGGRTSHTAILARSLGIPAVVGLESATSLVPADALLIIDGNAGVVVINPSPATLCEYRERKEAYDRREFELGALRDLPAETLDGATITLQVNLELPEEVPQALACRADGVGLYRTEFLYMNRTQPPDEEEQLHAYRSMIEKMTPRPVTIRTLDVGGDKFVEEISLAGEANPALGLRAIRFSLKEVQLFRTQLRAILRASAFGPVRIMFPMISGVAEVRACRRHLEQAKAELQAEGHAFDPQLPVGVMIETPAAALIAELLAREVDFFSVGTNDLVQYCLAVDRGNEHVAYLYAPLHPSILRALRLICDAARSAGIPVGMCGEMAAEPRYTLVLLGLGFSELSMNVQDLLRVKRIIRQVRRSEGVELLQQLLALPTAGEVGGRLDGEMARRFPELFAAGIP